MILTLFGYPKTGKTLLFNLLTDQHETVSKFSTPTNEFHKAVVDVPDERLKRLTEIEPSPLVHAKIEYLDTGAIAFGEVKNATFIDLIRRADGLVHVIRGFTDPEILHPLETVDPARDIRSMEEELKATDFLSIEKRLERLTVDIKKIKLPELQKEFEILGRLKEFLESGKPLREYMFRESEEPLIRGFKFLSRKPLLNVINADEQTLKTHLPLARPPANGTATAVFAGKIEQELLELPAADRPVFQQEYGLTDYHYLRDGFIRQSYELMGLISFFTTGKDETRAWTIEKGTNAFVAAGKIHSDIQRGFIRAEVINWKEYLASQGFTRAKEKGLLRLEGKDYVIRDGEIVHFRFNA
jgi:GTP-binding protein YchF